jgi:hypothetical protein
MLTTPIPATLSSICHRLKVLLDFLFDGPATKSGSATPGRPRQQHTTYHDDLREWKKHMDGWLVSITTDAALSEQYAFLRRLLRQSPAEPLDTVAVTASALYSAFMEGARAGDIRYFVERMVATSTPQEIAGNHSLIAALANIYGAEHAKQALPLLAESLAESERQRLATVLGADVATGLEVAITLPARFQGMYGIGATGTGKTTLLLNMVLSDIRKKKRNSPH